MGTPSITVPTIVSQRTAYVPEQPIVVPIAPQVFVQTAQPVIRTIPTQIIVSRVLRNIFDTVSARFPSRMETFHLLSSAIFILH
jgi:hypothetical protein